MLANPNKFLEEELQWICEFVRRYSQKINPISKFQSREKCISLSKAIYTVGKGDGIYLDLLYSDGKIKEWDFFDKWVIK